jgi:putative transposase
MKRGLPRALMTDNGAAMLAEETRGLERLGIDHKTTLAYSPYQNGKQETFWGQLESRLDGTVARKSKTWSFPLSIRRPRPGSNRTIIAKPPRNQDIPLQRMLTEPMSAGRHPDSETLRLAFTRRITRTPRRSDATLSVDGIRYELPVRFAHMQSVILRAPGWDKSQMMLVDPANTDAPLGTPSSPGQNQKRFRQTPQSSKAGPEPILSIIR